jgi:UDP-N-acetylmuramate--alanine ligase
LVAEADESDGSFSFLAPTVAVVTNIDAEHLEHYGSIAALTDAFVAFANRVPFYGQAIVCLDDPGVRAILPRLHKRTVTYGLDDAADYRATNVRHDGGAVRFDVIARGTAQGEFVLHMPGVHNAVNALATIALCDEQQVHVEATRAAIANFAGVQRRFTVRGVVGDVMVVDDYGHHPTEIRATLAGARRAHPSRRIVACLQPHRFTRVRDHFEAFARCLDEADLVFVTDVYPAGEAPIPGIDAPSLCAAIRAVGDPGRVVHVPVVAELASALAAIARPHDLVVTLGAGSITRSSHELVALLGAPR